MLYVDVIYVGNGKEKYFKDACDEYAKRLGSYCIFTQKCIKDEKLSQNPSDAEITSALFKEGEKILAAIPEKSYKVALCIEGKEVTSMELSNILESLSTKGFSKMCFIIGSSEGLSEEVKAKCDFRLSMSKMTFPHRLARVMLCEQIYRSMSIIGGSKYHK